MAGYKRSGARSGGGARRGAPLSPIEEPPHRARARGAREGQTRYALEDEVDVAAVEPRRREGARRPGRGDRDDAGGRAGSSRSRRRREEREEPLSSERLADLCAEV